MGGGDKHRTRLTYQYALGWYVFDRDRAILDVFLQEVMS